MIYFFKHFNTKNKNSILIELAATAMRV